VVTGENGQARPWASTPKQSGEPFCPPTFNPPKFVSGLRAEDALLGVAGGVAAAGALGATILLVPQTFVRSMICPFELSM